MDKHEKEMWDNQNEWGKTKTEKCYNITMVNDEVRTIENVETIKFSDGNLSAYNSEGDIVAHYSRSSYKYFEMVNDC